MKKETNKPWERQKGESAQAFEAFTTYRDMGPERSQQAVSRKLAKSRQIISRWSSQWNWLERVRAYENELEKEARARAVKDCKEMTDRHINIAMQLQEKALEALGALSVDKMSPKDIKEYIKMATDLERLNRTFEEQSNDGKTVSSLAEAIITAYEKRKE